MQAIRCVLKLYIHYTYSKAEKLILRKFVHAPMHIWTYNVNNGKIYIHSYIIAYNIYIIRIQRGL